MCNKTKTTKRKAFTLIELLIVIAIIGILFIVLVSKVDFATDKAKATGVQTDFRSFQLAFDTVAKENAGFNTFGWDTGDANQDGIRNSYDEGDNGAGGGIAKNGIQDGTEVFTGHKVYAETFTKIFSLKKAKEDGTLETNYDRDALNRLETAINANLDPKLHITIKDDGEIVMANGAQDPWDKEYHGWYITNAEVDKKDRGAIVMYSDGANNEFGSEHSIANGVVTISVPGSNKAGKDDYSIVSLYTYVNGYGEVKNITSGFSNNQTMMNGDGFKANNSDDNIDEEFIGSATFKDGVTLTWDELMLPENGDKYDYDHTTITSTTIGNAFYCSSTLVSIVIPDSVTSITSAAFQRSNSVKHVSIGKGVETIATNVFYDSNVASITVSKANKHFCSIDGVLFNKDQTTLIAYPKFREASSYVVPETVNRIEANSFSFCRKLTNIVFSNQITFIGGYAFERCTNLTDIVFPGTLTKLEISSFRECNSLSTIQFNGTVEQWNAIKKSSSWYSNIIASSVICLDGTVSLNK